MINSIKLFWYTKWASLCFVWIKRIYKLVFDADLATKPKPFRVNLLVVTTISGWLLVRTRVLNKFDLCKDIGYLCVIHVLDEILPQVFFQYEVIFRSGNIERYTQVMFRFLITYIIWDRHHYDRSTTLSMLNDFYHRRQSFPEYYNQKKEWLNLITEKKSRNMAFTAPFSSLQTLHWNEIHNIAIALAASTTAKAFYNNFVRPYTAGMDSEKTLNLWQEKQQRHC